MNKILVTAVSIFCAVFASAAWCDIGRNKACTSYNDGRFCPPVIFGKITFDDLRTIEAMKSPADLKMIDLNSDGGDIEAAISISRFLRSRGGYWAAVHSGYTCSSACVLLLAGANNRQVEGRVGIHRPYTIMNERVRSRSEIAAEQRKIETLVKEFLIEINVNPSLYDDMIGIPPHRIKYLSKSELERYRLVGKESVTEQSEAEEISRDLGISVQEYLRRKARIERCQSGECANAELYGISINELERRRGIANRICAGSNDERSCYHRVFIKGAP